MGRYKVAVYAICKNESKFVERWVNSMSEADEIYVTDTGSSDDTVDKLKKAGVKVQTVILDEWRFDTARNISLDHVPEDIDICVCTDLDEVFAPGWRYYLEEAWQKDTTRLRYMYTWNFKEDGSPDTTFWGEKIHARKGFRWTHPVHEILEYNGSIPDKYVFEGRIHLNHYPDSGKSRGQYLPLLELSVAEDPDDDRNVHYLGREYMFYGRWDECIETLKRHLSLPSAVWKDERAASMRYIARAYAEKKDDAQAEKWLYRAIAEAPYLREAYIEAAKLAYTKNDWLKVYFMVNEALKITQKPTSYINEGFCWDSTPYDLAAIACYYLGIFDKALYFAEKAAEADPNDKRLQNNLKIIKDKN